MANQVRGEILVAGTNGDTVSPEIVELVRATGVTTVCSDSLLKILLKQLPEEVAFKRIPISPVGECLHRIGSVLRDSSILVLTSGDPLFFGFGRTIKERFNEVKITFSPALSSMQVCFARFGISWDDADFLSLHGRPMASLGKLLQSRKLFIFTDSTNSPAQIAKYLIGAVNDSEIKRYIMYIGEKLGTSREQLFTGSPHEVSKRVFSQPNCLIIVKREDKNDKRNYRFGLKESQLRHSRGLITKNEVRAAVLHSLNLPVQGIFWDIGAGSGSVSIEAARLNPFLNVYAIEKNETELKNISYNKESFRCWNITIVAGTAPEILASLPKPDRIFVGGSGGNLKEILEKISDLAPAESEIVVTGVVENTCNLAPKLLYELGYRVEISVVTTTRYNYPDKDQLDFNPIHIIRAAKK